MANVNIRINSEIKKKAEEVFKNLGMTPTTAITLFYIQAIRTNSIPFDLIVGKPNETTVRAIEEAEEDMKNPSKSNSYSSVKELLEDCLDDLHS